MEKSFNNGLVFVDTIDIMQKYLSARKCCRRYYSRILLIWTFERTDNLCNWRSYTESDPSTVYDFSSYTRNLHANKWIQPLKVHLIGQYSFVQINVIYIGAFPLYCEIFLPGIALHFAKKISSL